MHKQVGNKVKLWREAFGGEGAPPLFERFPAWCVQCWEASITDGDTAVMLLAGPSTARKYMTHLCSKLAHVVSATVLSSLVPSEKDFTRHHKNGRGWLKAVSKRLAHTQGSKDGKIVVFYGQIVVFADDTEKLNVTMKEMFAALKKEPEIFFSRGASSLFSERVPVQGAVVGNGKYCGTLSEKSPEGKLYLRKEIPFETHRGRAQNELYFARHVRVCLQHQHGRTSGTLEQGPSGLEELNSNELLDLHPADYQLKVLAALRARGLALRPAVVEAKAARKKDRDVGRGRAARTERGAHAQQGRHEEGSDDGVDGDDEADSQHSDDGSQGDSDGERGNDDDGESGSDEERGDGESESEDGDEDEDDESSSDEESSDGDESDELPALEDDVCGPSAQPFMGRGAFKFTRLEDAGELDELD